MAEGTPDIMVTLRTLAPTVEMADPEAAAQMYRMETQLRAAGASMARDTMVQVKAEAGPVVQATIAAAALVVQTESLVRA